MNGGRPLASLTAVDLGFHHIVLSAVRLGAVLRMLAYTRLLQPVDSEVRQQWVRDLGGRFGREA